MYLNIFIFPVLYSVLPKQYYILIMEGLPTSVIKVPCQNSVPEQFYLPCSLLSVLPEQFYILRTDHGRSPTYE